MKVARLRLIVATLAFVGWLGYLAYLALGHSKPVIVSHSQVMAAHYAVKAEIAIGEPGSPKAEVKVLESFGDNPIKAETINVDNLSDARLPGGKPIGNPGAYLLLLDRTHVSQFNVVRSPVGREPQGRLFVVYPWSADVERQIHELLAKP
jgi:hypothetical protein